MTIMGHGEFHRPEALLGMGMVDGILPPEDVLNRAAEDVRARSTLPHEAFSLVKRNHVEAVEQDIRSHRQEKGREFIDRWYRDDTRTRLREAMERF